MLAFTDIVCVCCVLAGCKLLALLNHHTTPSTRWGARFYMRFACCRSQGGGIFITGSSTQVNIQNSNIYSNTATYVSACRSKAPDGPQGPVGVLAFTDIVCACCVRSQYDVSTRFSEPQNITSTRWGARFY